MGVGLWLISVLMSLKQGQYFPFCKFGLDVRLFWLERDGLFTCVASAVLDTWKVVLPDTILGFDGSCVLVPCHFTISEQMFQDLLNCGNRAIRWGRVPDRPTVIISPVAPSQVPNP